VQEEGELWSNEPNQGAMCVCTEMSHTKKNLYNYHMLLKSFKITIRTFSKELEKRLDQKELT
jgi:hypothetical protein